MESKKAAFFTYFTFYYEISKNGVQARKKLGDMYVEDVLTVSQYQKWS